MRHIIFDFDGTLADSLPLVISVADEILGVRLPDDEIQRLRNMPMKAVIKEARIPLWRVPRLLMRGRAVMAARLGEVNTFKTLSKVIEELAHEKRLYVVSSNSKELIDQFLRTNNMSQYFTAIYGSVALFNKANVLKKVMRSEGMMRGDTIYVGDEVRDVEAAKKSGIAIVSVTWGFNGKSILNQYQPDFLVDTPEALLKVLKSL